MDGTEFFELRDLLAPSTRYQLGAFECISTEDSLRDPYHFPDGKPGDIGVEAGFQHPVVQPNWQPESREYWGGCAPQATQLFSFQLCRGTQVGREALWKFQQPQLATVKLPTPAPTPHTRQKCAVWEREEQVGLP